MKELPFLLALVGISLLGSQQPAAAQICPDSKTVSGPQVQARVGSWKRQSVVDERSAIYNPPPGCFVMDCQARVMSSFGLTSSSVSLVAADSTFVSEEQIDESYAWAADLAANLAAQQGAQGLTAELEAALVQERRRHLQYVTLTQASHQTCRLFARATGRGTLVDKGSSIVMSADIELCCGGMELQSESHLQNHLESFIWEYIAEHGLSGSVAGGGCGQVMMKCDECTVEAGCPVGEACERPSSRCSACTLDFECQVANESLGSIDSRDGDDDVP
jgi:hypothetical protein